MKKLIRVLILLSFVAAILLPVAPQVAHKILKNHAKIVMIMSPKFRGGGTGFHIQAPSGRTYIMTNRHVCEVGQYKAFKKIPVRKDENGKIIYAKKGVGLRYVKIVDGFDVKERAILKVSQKHDLCLIQPTKKNGIMRIGTPIDLLPVLTAGFGGLDSISANIGYRNGPHMASVCYESAFLFGCTDLRFMKTDAYTFIVRGGHSGSPVISPLGSLVGVVFAGSGRETLVVPIKFVTDFLKNK